MILRHFLKELSTPLPNTPPFRAKNHQSFHVPDKSVSRTSEFMSRRRDANLRFSGRKWDTRDTAHDFKWLLPVRLIRKNLWIPSACLGISQVAGCNLRCHSVHKPLVTCAVQPPPWNTLQ
jgi:hypothetical protein